MKTAFFVDDIHRPWVRIAQVEYSHKTDMFLMKTAWVKEIIGRFSSVASRIPINQCFDTLGEAIFEVRKASRERLKREVGLQANLDEIGGSDDTCTPR